MNIPKNIKIGGHNITVKYPYKFKERSDIFGLTNHTRYEILLADMDENGIKLCKSKILNNFWHEVIHQIDGIYNGLNLDEDTVIRLGQGLFQVLNDNFYINPKILLPKEEKSENTSFDSENLDLPSSGTVGNLKSLLSAITLNALKQKTKI